MTVVEQLLYEVTDPGAHPTPDVTPDMAGCVCARAREDTLTTSLYLDTHGKSPGSVLLGLLEPGAASWPERG